MNSIRLEGRVKFFNQDKGFGFIRNPLSPEQDIFVHISEMPKGLTLERGDLVGFGTKQVPKGMAATGVELLKRADRERTQHESATA